VLNTAADHRRACPQIRPLLHLHQLLGENKLTRVFKKASLAAFPLSIVEDELRPFPSKGWAEMIRKLYEVDPMLCPRCGGKMKVVAFITDFAVVDKIIDHLKLSFSAERPPPSHIAYQELLMAAEAPAEYLS